MSRLVVVRPEPGNAETMMAAARAGLIADAMPLFAVEPVAWTPPAGAVDALLLTSANAARHGGAIMASLRRPVVAVGTATAAAAAAAGLTVVLTGDGDGERLVDLARARGFRRLLHLAGEHHRPLPVAGTIVVYASRALPPPPDAATRLDGAAVLLHSARAAHAVAALRLDRSRTAVAAISMAALAAAGPGWRRGVAAAAPTDAALLAAAAALD